MRALLEVLWLAGQGTFVGTQSERQNFSRLFTTVCWVGLKVSWLPSCDFGFGVFFRLHAFPDRSSKFVAASTSFFA